MERDILQHYLVCAVDYCICTTCSKAQQCLQANEGGGILPNFVDRGNQGRILHRNQAIISSYEFKCCGKITEWGADVYSNPVRDNEDDDSDSDDGNVVTQTFNIQFQVWRPSPTVESDGCYSLVGENRFTSISLQTGVIRETPLVPQQIAVQPGDIVGFRLEGEYPSANPGVVLDSSYSNESVWYGNIDGITPGPSNCPYPVGSIGRLRTSTNLGPVILASLGK